MSNLIVITFENEHDAGAVFDSLRRHSDRISLDDSAIIVKDENGKVHVKNQMDRGVVIGAVGGGFLGLLLASIFFPVAGLIIGALGGALVGASADLGIQKKFVQEVSEDLQPGTSALFVLVRGADPNVALGVLRPYKGTVRHTSLDPDKEEQVRDALKKEIR
jgi:uncharacterized membrane protein